MNEFTEKKRKARPPRTPEELAIAESFTIKEFVRLQPISRAKLYQLWKKGIGPRFFKVGSKVLISREAAIAWRRDMEAREHAGR